MAGSPVPSIARELRDGIPTHRTSWHFVSLHGTSLRLQRFSHQEEQLKKMPGLWVIQVLLGFGSWNGQDRWERLRFDDSVLAISHNFSCFNLSHRSLWTGQILRDLLRSNMRFDEALPENKCQFVCTRLFNSVYNWTTDYIMNSQNSTDIQRDLAYFPMLHWIFYSIQRPGCRGCQARRSRRSRNWEGREREGRRWGANMVRPQLLWRLWWLWRLWRLSLNTLDTLGTSGTVGTRQVQSQSPPLGLEGLRNAVLDEFSSSCRQPPRHSSFSEERCGQCKYRWWEPSAWRRGSSQKTRYTDRQEQNPLVWESSSCFRSQIWT